MIDALLIGCWQCTAHPGITRSGATSWGLLRGIDHEASAHFSFLIATNHPGWTVLEVPVAA
jgi:undecaprenyl-diphosphatase